MGSRSSVLGFCARRRVLRKKELIILRSKRLKLERVKEDATTKRKKSGVHY